MEIKTICVLGGTGFVGRHLVNRLHRDGYNIRMLTRRYERGRNLLVIPTLQLIEADIHDCGQLDRHFGGCEAVVNLVGILNERGDDGRGFHHAHVELTEKVVAACKRRGVARYLHMSALNAHASAPSHYLQSKGRAEDLAHAAATPEFRVTSFRPSVIFGPDDSFLNLFARLLRLSPLVFPLACPQARFAPVYVGDVVEAFATALTEPASGGRRYDLCGPNVYTFRALVAYVNELIGTRRLIIPLPDALSRLQANVFEHLPGKPFSRDNLRSLQVDSVCGGANGLAALGLPPTPIEAVAPLYLGHRRVRERYTDYRATFGRTHT